MDNNYLLKFYNLTLEKLNFIKNIFESLIINDSKIIAKKYDLFDEIEKTSFFIKLCIDNISKTSKDSILADNYMLIYLSYGKIEKSKFDILSMIQDKIKSKIIRLKKTKKILCFKK